MLYHRIRAVAPPLAPHVEHLWLARGYLPTRWRNMLLPDGAIEIIFNLGDPQKLCMRDDLTQETDFRESWISGERTKPIVIDEFGHVDLIGIRLRPGGAWPVIGIPIAEFTEQVIELNTFLGREISELREMLGGASDDDARFDALECWLRRRITARIQPTPAVTRALRLIRNDSESMPVTQIAHEIGISHKHLLREFDRCVGLAPKAFSRLCSFQRVIRVVGHNSKVDWAGTAARFGYYDQGHFIREFRAFSGLTPGEYLEKRGPYLNYIELR